MAQDTKRSNVRHNGERNVKRPSWAGTLSPFLDDAARDAGVAELLERAGRPEYGRLTVSAVEGVRPAVAAAVAQRRPVAIVTASSREAESVADDIRSWWPGELSRVAVLPAWETLPHERLSPRADTVAQRMAVFRRLKHPQDDDAAFGAIDALVMPVRSLLQPVAHGLGDIPPLIFAAGEPMDLEEAVRQLERNAYQRVDLVMNRGQYAVRGGLVDVFPPTASHPVRIEFFGDEIDEISEFHASDQRTYGEPLPSVWATACREIPLDDAVRARAKSLVGRIANADEMLESISQGIPVEGMESLMPVLVDDLDEVPDLLPRDAIILLTDPGKLRRSAEDLSKTADEFLSASWHVAASGKGQGAPLDFGRASFLDLEACLDALTNGHHPVWGLTDFSVDADKDDELRIDAVIPPECHGDGDKAVAAIGGLVSEGLQVVVTAAGKGTVSRLQRAISAGVPSGVLYKQSKAAHGFIDRQAGLAVVTEFDLVGHTSAAGGAKTTRRRHHAIDLLDLKPGDYVVHEQHGIGRFVKLEQRPVGKTAHGMSGHAGAPQREYLVIEYASSRKDAPTDKLYIPTDQMDQVSKYLGADQPKLNKLGGSDWATTKAKAKKHVTEIAQDLVKLYSARRHAAGFAFSPDTPWQRELEDAFPYQETPDQLRTIDEVKADMEKPVPMDRLLSGDVGFGKTEIAVRAAFKAVQDGKQVAVLAPTTLLVQQHVDTFTQRYEGFPITVKALSRFQNAKETKETLESLANGGVDVVIGTHKLLNPKIKFKDLGLVIIDEEQRFGVEHKETLKALRTNVDVLSMSATPIPRTLEMAVTGIRQMSTLATPPEDRLPVLTYVGAYEDALAAAAIRREILRGGQVFYVHNRVNDIPATVEKIRELVPGANIGVGHGKMTGKQLDIVINDFWQHKIDVLVCTTIIETGLDISNANTLIVDQADRYGLSQLHQLRGRVGRSRERAYAYFLYDPTKPMTQVAHDRLATIAQNTALGSGYDVALKDLELRGVGNLLGSEQSGHIEGVGFDLYVRMVSQAIEEYRDPGKQEQEPVTVDLPIDATIPGSYIASDKLRLEAYAKIASAGDEQELDDVRDELADRYGAVPPQVLTLFDVARLRWKAAALGLSEITTQGSRVRFVRIDPPESVRARLSRIYRGYVYRPVTHLVLIPSPFEGSFDRPAMDSRQILDWVNQVLDDLAWKADPRTT
ncbi:MAG: transcription-repair coupling factor [Aeriscardovia sp.]|nr:transcription-repair coupling factor [Aeriscardovia sp.]